MSRVGCNIGQVAVVVVVVSMFVVFVVVVVRVAEHVGVGDIIGVIVKCDIMMKISLVWIVSGASSKTGSAGVGGAHGGVDVGE